MHAMQPPAARCRCGKCGADRKERSGRDNVCLQADAEQLQGSGTGAAGEGDEGSVRGVNLAKASRAR